METRLGLCAGSRMGKEERKEAEVAVFVCLCREGDGDFV